MRPIPGYPGYSITRDGRVWSEPRRNARRGRWLSPQAHAGYLRVDLCCAGKHNWRLIHRLVLEAFVGPCPEGTECCHNNGDRLDNRVDNLRRDTRSNNHLDAVGHGTHPGLRRKGENHPLAKLTDGEAREIEQVGHTRHLTITHLAKAYNVSRSCATDIVQHRTWKHLWEDVECQRQQ